MSIRIFQQKPESDKNWLELLKQENDRYVTENKAFMRDCCKSIYDLSLIYFHSDITVARGNFAVTYHADRSPCNYAVTYDGENSYNLTGDQMKTVIDTCW